MQTLLSLHYFTNAAELEQSGSQQHNASHCPVIKLQMQVPISDFPSTVTVDVILDFFP